MQRWISLKQFFNIFHWFQNLCVPGHIHQVKDNLSKTPKELIPSVFPNTWGITTKILLTSFCQSLGVLFLSLLLWVCGLYFLYCGWHFLFFLFLYVTLWSFTLHLVSLHTSLFVTFPPLSGSTNLLLIFPFCVYKICFPSVCCMFPVYLHPYASALADVFELFFFFCLNPFGFSCIYVLTPWFWPLSLWHQTQQFQQSCFK